MVHQKRLTTAQPNSKPKMAVVAQKASLKLNRMKISSNGSKTYTIGFNMLKIYEKKNHSERISLYKDMAKTNFVQFGLNKLH